MKTIVITLLAFITLNISSATARSNSPKGTDGPSNSEFSIPLSLLAPVTPAEATFEETDSTPDLTGITSLAPVTPKDATFEEITTPVSLPVHQNSKSIEKGKSPHYDFPLPCDAKYGCSL
jgi:hypothetical protein